MRELKYLGLSNLHDDVFEFTSALIETFLKYLECRFLLLRLSRDENENVPMHEHVCSETFPTIFVKTDEGNQTVYYKYVEWLKPSVRKTKW